MCAFTFCAWESLLWSAVVNLQIFQLASEPILVLRSKQKDGGKKDERSTIEKLNQNPKSKKKEFSMNLDSVGHGNHNHWAGGNALALHESDMSSMYRLDPWI